MADTRALFRAKAPDIMRRLMADFDLDVISAAAILGNLGHESGGFRFLQEKKPLVSGSAGGYGWAQWTGPRRRAYEAYCQRTGLDPASDKANYAFLYVELTGSESSAVPAVKGATGLRAKVEAFERAFERAGIKAYDSRETWAKEALAAWDAARVPVPHTPADPVKPDPAKPIEKKPAPADTAKKGAAAAIIAALGAMLSFAADHPVLIAIGLVTIGLAAWGVEHWWQSRRAAPKPELEDHQMQVAEDIANRARATGIAAVADTIELAEPQDWPEPLADDPRIPTGPGRKRSPARRPGRKKAVARKPVKAKPKRRRA